MYLSFITYSEILTASYIKNMLDEELDDPQYLYEIDDNTEEFTIYRIYSCEVYSREEIMCKLTYMEKFRDTVCLVSSLLDGGIIDSNLTQFTASIDVNNNTVWVAQASNQIDRPMKKTLREKFMKKISNAVDDESKGFDFNPAIIPF